LPRARPRQEEEVIHEPSVLAVVVFVLFVGLTLGVSFYFARRSRSAHGYYAAGGNIHWFINGVAFAGDYLSAASFLGICGMIAFYGYDGFLYSIGYLAGWIVALFVIAEPLKRMGRYTFADALDRRFQSRAIKLTAAVSTLVVSIFYLIPQMVGAGVLVRPLLGIPHAAGVMLVGAIVILIVVTAGMVSTTYVQFLKGSLLVIFSAVLAVLILVRGLERSAPPMTFVPAADDVPTFPGDGQPASLQTSLLVQDGDWANRPYFRWKDKATGQLYVYRKQTLDSGGYVLLKVQTLTERPDGSRFVNGLPHGLGEGEEELEPVGHISRLPNADEKTGPLGPLEFVSVLSDSEVVLNGSEQIREADGSTTTVYYPKPTSGRDVLRPGNHPQFAGIRSGKLTDKLNFISLMLALFAGTASLPHILIRYYTVKNEAAARKSTVVGIGSIGFFYVLTLYLGLGAMVSGALDPTDSNMAAPLLAKSFPDGGWLFAIISAIAFTTVLGTVSGLIVAASGAVVHDLLASVGGMHMTDHEKVRIGKISAVVVGIVAVVLGILFAELNVSYLVGWAFSVAASANLPSLVTALFWRGATREGIAAAVLVGMASSLAWILLSGDTFKSVYGLSAEDSPVPFSQPGIVTIPLGFAVVIAVSLLTRRKEASAD
jgi:cation/acetate symporter